MKRSEAWYAEHLARTSSRFTTGVQTPAKAIVDTTKPAPSKFGNKKVDGYDSKRERDRATVLRLMQEAGAIKNLREKVVYILIPAQQIDGKCVERACTYTADFVYEDLGGRAVVEDVKGYPNDRWPLKRKLMLFVHGIRVQEVK